MPLAVDNLNEQSGQEQIREAISQSMQTCMNEGKEQKQCAAIAHDIAREKTGKSLDFGR